MDVLRMVFAVILLFTAAAVAVYFVIAPLTGSSMINTQIWYYLDLLMALSLLAALVVQLQRKRAAEVNKGEGLSREWLEANAMFYLSVIVSLWFFRNWFDLLQIVHLSSNPLGSQSVPTWVIWDILDALIPVVLGVTGFRLWRNSSPAKDQSPE